MDNKYLTHFRVFNMLVYEAKNIQSINKAEVDNHSLSETLI